VDARRGGDGPGPRALHRKPRRARCSTWGVGPGRCSTWVPSGPERYTGIDPSQGMLNALVRKHCNVFRLLAARVQDVPDGLLAESYELVVAPDVALTPEQVERLRRLAPGLLVTM